MRKNVLYSTIAGNIGIDKKIVEFVVNYLDRKVPVQEIIVSVKDRLHYVITENEIDIINESSKLLLKSMSNIVKEGKDIIDSLNENTEDKPKYEFIDDCYILYSKNKATQITEKYTLPLDMVDKIFNDFSKHGGNLSSQAIMNKYNLKPKVRQLIKSHIGLYKDSHILSPMSMDNAVKNGNIDEVIQEATYNNFEDKYKGKYKESHVSTLEKEVKKLSRIVGEMDGMIEYIAPLLNNIKPLNIGTITKGKFENKNTTIYAFGDAHIGKMETNKVIKRLDLLAQDIVNDKNKKVVMFDLGDNFEALMQGGMHSGQVESMDGVYMGDLFMKGVQIFVDFISTILKAGKEVEFIGLGGNHDRISTINNMDTERFGAIIFYKMLSLYFQNYKIEIKEIKERIATLDVGGLHIIANHGEEFGKTDAEKTARKYGDSKMQNVILTAHLHSIKVLEGKNVTHVQTPALAGQNKYDKDHGWFSHPGYVKIKENEHGLPDVEIKRLP